MSTDHRSPPSAVFCAAQTSGTKVPGIPASLTRGGTATLSTGISNGNVLVATSGIADNDFLRVDGTSIEGRSASEVLSDIGATTASAAADEATALAIALG